MCRAYRSLLPVLAAALLVAAGYGLSLPAPPAATIQLPVLTVRGYSVPSRSFTLADASLADSIYLVTHRARRDGDLRFRINGAAWDTLRNSNTLCHWPEKYGGHNGGAFDGSQATGNTCFGGFYSTVRFSTTLQVANLVTGANAIEFEYIGFKAAARVLYFNVLDGATRLIPEDEFFDEDPETWTAPITPTPTVLQRGKFLYENAALLSDNEGPLGPSVTAKCIDCHAQGGYDLEYFAFENEGIRRVAEDRGLTAAEGDTIATYIRSNSVLRYGRPWDPPYQPGPSRMIPTVGACTQGMPADSLPEVCWAAGAGYQWGQVPDDTVKTYLVGAGFSSVVFNTDSTLNMRHLPMPMLAPDWQEWLPREHPMDIWGSAFTTDPVWTNWGVDSTYQADMDNPSLTAHSQAQKDIYDDAQTFREDYAKAQPQPPQDSLWIFQALMSWANTRRWEMMRGHEAEAPAVYASDPFARGEPRSWYGQEGLVFETSTHIHKGYTWGDNTSPNDAYFDDVWYMMACVISCGNRAGLHVQKPIDDKYTLQHRAGMETNIPPGWHQPWYYGAEVLKLYQKNDNKAGVGTFGWYLRHVTLPWVYGGGGAKDVLWQGLKLKGRDQEYRDLVTWLIRAHTRKQLAHANGEWTRTTGCTGIEPDTFVPVPYTGKGTLFDDCTYANHYYRIFPLLIENVYGDAPTAEELSVLDSLRDDSETKWPLATNPTWQELFTYEPPAPAEWPQFYLLDDLTGAFYAGALGHINSSEERIYASGDSLRSATDAGMASLMACPNIAGDSTGVHAYVDTVSTRAFYGSYGLTLRESAAADAPSVTLEINRIHRARLVYRQTTGGALQYASAASTAAPLPACFDLEYQGGMVRAYWLPGCIGTRVQFDSLNVASLGMSFTPGNCQVGVLMNGRSAVEGYAHTPGVDIY